MTARICDVSKLHAPPTASDWSVHSQLCRNAKFPIATITPKFSWEDFVRRGRKFEGRVSTTTRSLPLIQTMESRAHGVLGGKISRIKESNVDPAWLAQRLYSAKIIGKADEERAKKSDVPEAQRCGKLVEMVQRNGRKGVFQTFVSILLSEPHLDWLGEELRGKVYSGAHTLLI